MTDPFPDESESEQARRSRLFGEIAFGRGWMRRLTPSAVVVLSALASLGSLDREEIGNAVAGDTETGRGLDAPAWDPPHAYTDDELAAQRAQFAATPFAADEEELQLDADAVNADEAAREQRLRDRMERYAVAVGVAPVHTIADLIDLLAACRVVTIDEHGRYALNPHARCPARSCRSTRRRYGCRTACAKSACTRPSGGAVKRVLLGFLWVA